MMKRATTKTIKKQASPTGSRHKAYIDCEPIKKSRLILMPLKKRNQSGHFCKVCREHKANEKFSGKGHAAHICKSCAALPPAERAERETISKIEGMTFRRLNDSEIKWLRSKMSDKRASVSEAARALHTARFPRYERGMIKKGLTAVSLEFFINGRIWDDQGEEKRAYMRFFADNSGLFRRVDYSRKDERREAEISIDRKEAGKYLKSVIHELDALFWEEDLSDAAQEYDGEADGILPVLSAEKGKTYWSLSLELSNGENKTITFYHRMHSEPQSLFWSLMEIFDYADNM